MRVVGTVAAIATVLSVLIVALTPPAHGDIDYPIRPVTLIVPYAAGGTPDVYARVIAAQLASRLNGTFIVENRVGGAGNPGRSHRNGDSYGWIAWPESRPDSDIGERQAAPQNSAHKCSVVTL